MDTFVWIILTTVGISLLSLVGVFTLSLSDRALNKILLGLVGLSAGTLMAGAFLHLIPEAIHEIDHETTMLLVLGGFIVFFILEKLFWRHCHKKDCKIHTFAYINLVGDGIHNFIDGLIIAASFLASVELGLITSLAVALHEIPQEIGDFGVLVYGGIEKQKALFYNLITALTALVGGIVGFFLIPQMGEFQGYIIPIAAGGILYIAASDLVPELHKETNTWKTILAFSMFMVGIVLMWLVKVVMHGGH